jgi:hypothetical protein
MNNGEKEMEPEILEKEDKTRCISLTMYFEEDTQSARNAEVELERSDDRCMVTNF